MRTPSSASVPASLLLVLLCTMMVTQIGCFGLYANLMHAVGANQVPPKYDGLEDTNLAIVTVTDSSHYSDDVSARLLSRNVGEVLTKKLDDVRLVREDKIQEWRDNNGWDSIDFREIGEGVGAEKVLGIELTNLRLRDGATMYRGRADVQLSVIDVATGEFLYRAELDEFTFPITAGQHTSETNEAKFRKLYLGMLANQIARHFHPYDPSELFALDGMMASQ